MFSRSSLEVLKFQSSLAGQGFWFCRILGVFSIHDGLLLEADVRPVSLDKTSHIYLRFNWILKFQPDLGWTMIVILSNLRSIFDSLLFTCRSRWSRASSCPSSPPSTPSRTPRGRPPDTAGSCSSPASRGTNHPIGSQDRKLDGFSLGEKGRTTAAQFLICSKNWTDILKAGNKVPFQLSWDNAGKYLQKGLALQIKEKTWS